MKHAPIVEHTHHRATKVTRSEDGLFYRFDLYCVKDSTLFNLLTGVPMRQTSQNGYHAEFTLPAQVVAEMFAGVAEAAMTPADSDDAADRILAPATA
ncbi:MAG TPA: hypothetical protein PK109_02830 [Candidatus Paceibacterota bacterium]|nr:hypothetical protein [Candidatus Paceibacterota bacterium]